MLSHMLLSQGRGKLLCSRGGGGGALVPFAAKMGE